MGRKYSCNENYFEVPTVENCYYAGLIATDGCISDTDKRSQKSLRLKLVEIDKEVLLLLHERLNLSNSLGKRQGFSLFKKGKEYVCKSQMILSCFSNKICDDLNTHWNVTPRKTNTLLPPNIKEPNLIKAFLCGVIDGDGSISIHQQQSAIIQIVSNSEQFLIWCKKILAKIGNVKESPKLYKDKNSYKLIYKCKKAREIIKSLWQVDVPRLKRKWDKVAHLKGQT